MATSFKDTLLMPKTEFPMRAGLAQKEPVLVQKWKDSNLYEKMKANRINAPVFMLHDGPPYANGDIHCGHALNRCLKDFIIRYKNMAGFNTPFIFGWDTHGLPIEVKVTKSGVNRKTTPVVEFRNKCDEYAHTQVARQKEQIRRLGVMGDYDHPYLTLLPEYEARQIEVFAKMALKGLIFKGLKPVYWSPSSESALAEAEVEYHDVTAKTMYVKFPVKDGKGLIPDDSYLVIWTTTPWTIPTNQAVAVNPLYEYGLYKTNIGNLVLLKELQAKLKEEWALTEMELLKTFKGQDMEYISYTHPLYPSRQGIVIEAAYVDASAGTGAVHIAPDHGVDDFNAAAKYGIKPYGPIDDKGCFVTGEGDPFNGMFYDDTNDLVIKMLEEKGLLIKEVDIVHSYPHDWRTKKPIIFRTTPQWFCSISPIRQQLLDEIHKITWVPAWGENKMVNMIKDRADWCISRQRAWGVPLPIIYCEDGTAIMEKEVFDHIQALVKEFGSNVWFEREAKDLLPEGYTNAHSPNGLFTKEKDIMDVWFDSGSSWNGTLVERGLKYPADVYLEGNDQYRGWFNSSMIVSMAVNGVAPFKTCITHGFVMDENWQKMSKSSGNGIDPNKIAEQYGADILRLWAASVDYQADARLSERIIGTAVDNYRKIRNTFKFMLGNLHGYSMETPKQIPALGKFVLAALEEAKNKCLSSYENYDFPGVINTVTSFMTGELSSFYLDVCKDVLYCDEASSSRRLAAQYVIYTCAKTFSLLLNPILPFTMEEVYSYLPGEKKESIQLEDMVKESHDYDASLLANYASYKALRSVVLKALEDARAAGKIGSSSEAEVDVLVKDEALFNLLSKEGNDEVSKGFIVSKVILRKGEEDACTVKVATGPLCPRCRNHVDHVVSIDGYEEKVCERCAKALVKTI